jgi:3-deoxy-D-manno-octulosonic-acid transferase
MKPLESLFYSRCSSLLFSIANFADRNLWMPATISETLHFRREWRRHLPTSNSKTKSKLWIHGASVGELEDLAAFFLSSEALNSAGLKPKDIVITSASVSTKSRLELWQKQNDFLYCGPLPPDTGRESGVFLEQLAPENLLLSHNDFWPNLFLKWRTSKGSKNFFWYFKPKQFSASRVKLFKSLRPIYLARSKPLPPELSDEPFQIVGNLRLDRILSRMNASQNTAHALTEWGAEPNAKRTSIIVGSCRLEDAKLISQLNPKFFNQYKWVVIPHHTDNIGEVAQINELLGARAKVIVRQGILAEAYRDFDLAWVGGGFSKTGSHNVLESIAWGVPTICGPNITPQVDAPHYVISNVLKPIETLEALNDFFENELWLPMQDLTKAFALTLRQEEPATNRLSKALRVSN